MDEADWQLRYGQQRARNAVFMQALATVARRSDEDREWAKRVVKAADEAAESVRIEDFTTARPQ